MARLSDDEITERLEGSPWERDGDAITRTFELEGFPEAIAFVDRVAEAAEEADHHPDIDIRWRRVTLTLSTHSEGGLTENDFALAGKADALA